MDRRRAGIPRIELGPMIRYGPGRHGCLVWIGGKAAGRVIRELPPGRRSAWIADGPVAMVWDLGGPDRRTGRKAEVLERLRCKLSVTSPDFRDSVISAAAAYDRRDGP